MSSSATHWRLDGLSASARATAEIASLGAGLSLSVWLTRLIADTCTREAAQAGAVADDADDDETEADDTAEAELAPPADADEPEPGPVAPAATSEAPQVSDQAPAAGALMLPVASMAPANLGTRRSDETPDALLADIAQRGVRQPLLVRSVPNAPERYDIICGHRRWRAAQRAGIARVPAKLTTEDDAHAILASLNENLALGDLSAIDEAHAYLRLLTRCAVDAGMISRATDRDRQHIIRTVRLLGLSPRLQQLIATGALSADHADLLLDAANPEALADVITGEHLSPEAARERLDAAPGAEIGP
jgi:ParB family chromosome partitioning protein